jgi:flagellar motor protein MotB
MFRRRIREKRSGEEENPFLLSFSDLMASLLAIFILALIVTLIELEKRMDQLAKREKELELSRIELIERLEEIRDIQAKIETAITSVSGREQSLTAMLEEIQKDLKDRGIEVVLAENGTVLRIPEQQLQFAPGKDEVPLTYTGPAKAIGHALLQALSRAENRAMLDTVFIEGHTDSVPFSVRMGNWGLSTYRAISLWNFWTDKPGELSALKSLRTLPPDPAQPAKPLISVSGYADTRSTHGLLDGQSLKADRPEDRRIDIRFTLVSAERKNLESLREDVQRMSEKTGALIRKLKPDADVP